MDGSTSLADGNGPWGNALTYSVYMSQDARGDFDEIPVETSALVPRYKKLLSEPYLLTAQFTSLPETPKKRFSRSLNALSMFRLPMTGKSSWWIAQNKSNNDLEVSAPHT